MHPLRSYVYTTGLWYTCIIGIKVSTVDQPPSTLDSMDNMHTHTHCTLVGSSVQWPQTGFTQYYVFPWTSIYTIDKSQPLHYWVRFHSLLSAWEHKINVMWAILCTMTYCRLPILLYLITSSFAQGIHILGISNITNAKGVVVFVLIIRME